MLALDIRRTKKRFFHETPRRIELPETWQEIPASMRVSVLRSLVENPGTPGQVQALRLLMGLKKKTFRQLRPADVAAILERCQWVELKPSPVPLIEFFDFNHTRYHFPAAHFRNAACLEYPMADECLMAFLQGDDAQALRLVSVLCREENPDIAAAKRRDDPRIPLYSWAEVDARAKALQTLPDGYKTAVLLYFIGVKDHIFQTFGSWLFQTPDPDTLPEEQPKGDPLGWWGLYMDACGGDMTKLEEIHQGNFETFCLLEVRRRKQQKELEMKQNMSSSSWGQNNS